MHEPPVLDRELVRGHPDYPATLAQLPNPPLRVRVRGALELDRPLVAIVGTRRADPEALAHTRALACALGRAGVTVVSGGALGIDSAAHQGALDARAPTVAVLPNGFSPAYPRTHDDLYRRILDGGGALLSEMDDGTPPLPHLMLRRNELVAALCLAVVVVQAPRVSGALSTAACARALARPIFAVPASPWDLRGEGSLGLLRKGALVCVEAEDVLSVCPPRVRRAGSEVAPAQLASDDTNDLDDDERGVLGALGSRPRHVDEIARETAMSASRVQRALMVLLLAGRVDERDGGRYVRAPLTR